MYPFLCLKMYPNVSFFVFENVSFFYTKNKDQAQKLLIAVERFAWIDIKDNNIIREGQHIVGRMFLFNL